MIKQQTVFYTLFKNIPYTDEEWGWLNKRRYQYRQENPTRCRRKPQEYKHLYHRPNHPFQHGPTCYSEEQARIVCEKALDGGAQMVVYAAYNQDHIFTKICGKDKIWREMK